MKNKQATSNKVEIIKDMIDMNNDGKISDDIPKILAFLASVRVAMAKIFNSKK